MGLIRLLFKANQHAGEGGGRGVNSNARIINEQITFTRALWKE